MDFSIISLEERSFWNQNFLLLMTTKLTIGWQTNFDSSLSLLTVFFNQYLASPQDKSAKMKKNASDVMKTKNRYKYIFFKIILFDIWNIASYKTRHALVP